MCKYSCFVLAAILIAALSATSAQAVLLVHYTGDLDGAKFGDVSGRGNDGTQDGTNQTSIAKIGTTAMKINGSATSVDVADGNPDFDRTYSEFSLSMWVNPGTNEHNRTRFYAGKMDGGGNRGWQISREMNQTMKFVYFDGPGGTQQDINTGATTIPADSWTHLAVTYKADDFLRFYVEGSLLSEKTETVDGILSLLNGANNAKFQVGNRGDDISGGTNGSPGAQIDDFGLWDEALTTAEIGQIYAGGLRGLNLQQALAIPEPSAVLIWSLLAGLGIGVGRRRREDVSAM